MKNTIALAVLAGTLLLACETGGDLASGNLTVKMIAETEFAGIQANARHDAPDDSVVFTHVLIGVTELEFEPLDDNDSECGEDNHEDGRQTNGDHGDGHDDDDDDCECDDDDGEDQDDSLDLEFEGEFIVDLLAGTSTPDFGIAQVVPGVYREIELELSPILPDSNSIFIAATIIRDDTLEYSVEFSTKRSFDLKIKRRSGIELTNSFSSILVVVDLDELFDGVNLCEATVDSNNVININETSNEKLAKQIAHNLKHALKWGKDDDKNGNIDDHDDDDDDEDDDDEDDDEGDD
jgi:hypothetical protein